MKYLVCFLFTTSVFITFPSAIFHLLSPLAGDWLASCLVLVLVLPALGVAFLAQGTARGLQVPPTYIVHVPLWTVVVCAFLSKAAVQLAASVFFSPQLTVTSERDVTGVWIVLRAMTVGFVSFGPIMTCLGYLAGHFCKKACSPTYRFGSWLLMPAVASLAIHAALHGSVWPTLPKPGCIVPALTASIAAVQSAFLVGAHTEGGVPSPRKSSSALVSSAKAARMRWLASWGAVLAVVVLAVGRMTAGCYPCKHYDPPLDLLEGQYSLLFSCEARRGGFISVVEGTLMDRFRYRILRVDHSIVGGEFVAPHDIAGQSVYTAFYLQQAVLAAVPPGKRHGAHRPLSLHIGLGIGTAVKGLQEAGVEADVVELHGEVFKAAQAYFGVYPRGSSIVGDAFVQVALLSNQSYTYAIHDVFSGGGAAPPLMQEAFFRQLKAKLHPKGVLAVNFVGSEGQPLKQLWCRLKLVFDHVRSFGDKEAALYKNYVVFASDEPLSEMEANAALLLKEGAERWTDGAREVLGSLGDAEVRMDFDRHQCTSLLGGTASHDIPPSWRRSQWGRHSLGRLIDWAEDMRSQYGMATHHWLVMRKQLGDALWAVY